MSVPPQEALRSPIRRIVSDVIKNTVPKLRLAEDEYAKTRWDFYRNVSCDLSYRINSVTSAE
jgi:hypothetical protein